ncbi:MAG TPA: COX15/CtaA family protein [Ferruginibacter sp.]|jgi:cytochrome c oxidase assembly protein subunit 15|nr:COX15/CtaA family protein [Ferruginibacter sp.]
MLLYLCGAMNDSSHQQAQRQVATWLMIGVAMIIVQVLLGGITRLTESGLSITEWKPITGTLPPLTDAAWQAEFDKYKVTDQFKYVHQNFTLKEFKFIFFWEWFHRTWARLMGLVFLIGFIYFLVKRKFDKGMIKPMIILFLLGGVQGFIGWFMVKSGLVPEKYFVGHVELTTHFIAALGLLCYTLWFALSLSVKNEQRIINPASKNFLFLILVVLVVQLIYGGFMAGLRAAITAPTWPDINGDVLPASYNELSPFGENLLNNPVMIHFIHRGLAYLLFVLILAWWIRSRAIAGGRLFTRLRSALLLTVLLQVVLGILTVLNATHANRLVVLGVAHQASAMFLLMILVSLLYLVRKRQ